MKNQATVTSFWVQRLWTDAELAAQIGVRWRTVARWRRERQERGARFRTYLHPSGVRSYQLLTGREEAIEVPPPLDWLFVCGGAFSLAKSQQTQIDDLLARTRELEALILAERLRRTA